MNEKPFLRMLTNVDKMSQFDGLKSSFSIPKEHQTN